MDNAHNLLNEVTSDYFKNVCALCNIIFRSKAERDYHNIFIHNLLSCDICNFCFPSAEQYKQHLRKWHKSNCSVCHALLYDEEQKEEHMQMAHNLKCDQCKELFQTDHLRNVHRRMRHPAIVQCEKCIKTFTGVHLYKIHFKANHSLACEFCNVKLLDEAQMNDHRHEAHNFKCTKCARISKTEMLRDEHTRNVHPVPKEARVPCDMCTNVFPTTGTYKMHFQDKHAISCNMCNIKLLGEEHKNEHMQLVHMFRCHLCADCFGTVELRNVHRETHHRYHFECVVCNRIFISEDDRRAHHKIVHDLKKCSLCEEMFHTSLALVEHCRWAHYKYKCVICDKAFQTDVLLNGHIKMLHRLECELCDKVYCTETSMQNHYLYGHMRVKVEREDDEAPAGHHQKRRLI